eukprot:9658878-Karenia_brevis.AAC.1
MVETIGRTTALGEGEDDNPRVRNINDPTGPLLGRPPNNFMHKLAHLLQIHMGGLRKFMGGYNLPGSRTHNIAEDGVIGGIGGFPRSG